MAKAPPISEDTITISGAPHGVDARVFADLVGRAGGPVIHVAQDAARMEAMRQALGFLAPRMPVLTFPAWDCVPFDRVSPAVEISAARMSTLAAVAHGVGGPMACAGAGRGRR